MYPCLLFMFYEANIHNCTENSAIFHEICTEVGAIMNENCTGNSAAPHSLITAFVLIVKLFNCNHCNQLKSLRYSLISQIMYYHL